MKRRQAKKKKPLQFHFYRLLQQANKSVVTEGKSVIACGYGWREVLQRDTILKGVTGDFTVLNGVKTILKLIKLYTLCAVYQFSVAA